MSELRNLLVPVDFSPYSLRALDLAIALARSTGGEITAIHVAPYRSVPVPPYGGAFFPEEPSAEQRADLISALRVFVAPAREAHVLKEMVLHVGDVEHEINRRAASMPADAIVLGTHGHGGFQRLVLGSITEKVLHKAPCPVLTVPAGVPETETAASAGGTIAFGTVLCPVDFSEPSAASVRWATQLAKAGGAKLVLLHVLEKIPEKDPRAYLHFNMPNYVSFLEVDARERIDALIPAEAKSAGETEQVFRQGKPHEEIVRLAEERNVGMIVMGVHGRDTIDFSLFGSTTNQVVRHASCPVLTVRRA